MRRVRIHAAVNRAVAAKLMSDSSSSTGRPLRPQLLEFVLHGVKYAFPPERGELTRGVPTGYAAPPLNSEIAGSSEPPPVWPYAEGHARGYAFAPLYRTVPEAALRAFVGATFARLLADEGFLNALPGLVVDGSPAVRTPIVLQRLRQLAELRG